MATQWMDEEHGMVTDGVYMGCLLRAGQSGGPYIDILLPHAGWQRLESHSMPYNADEDSQHLDELKSQVKAWLDTAATNKRR